MNRLVILLLALLNTFPSLVLLGILSGCAVLGMAIEVALDSQLIPNPDSMQTESNHKAYEPQVLTSRLSCSSPDLILQTVSAQVRLNRSLFTNNLMYVKFEYHCRLNSNRARPGINSDWVVYLHPRPLPAVQLKIPNSN
jgi:hypothetical protein